jgi:hypothetical protein
MAAPLSALRAGCTLPPGFFIFKDSWYSFPLEAELTPGPVWLEGLGQFKKSTSSGLEPYITARLLEVPETVPTYWTSQCHKPEMSLNFHHLENLKYHLKNSSIKYMTAAFSERLLLSKMPK